MNQACLLIGCTLALAMGGAAHAASCTVAVQDMEFGTYNPYSASPLDAAGSLSVQCSSTTGSTEEVNYAISISGSNRTMGSSLNPRILRGDGADMEYNLYLDGSRSRIWGDGSSGSEQAVGTVVAQSMGTATAMHTIFGRVPGQQPQIAPGDYTDILTVSISY
jgi:spore coat protein U-like protein